MSDWCHTGPARTLVEGIMDLARALYQQTGRHVLKQVVLDRDTMIAMGCVGANYPLFIHATVGEVKVIADDDLALEAA